MDHSIHCLVLGGRCRGWQELHPNSTLGVRRRLRVHIERGENDTIYVMDEDVSC